VSRKRKAEQDIDVQCPLKSRRTQEQQADAGYHGDDEREDLGSSAEDDEAGRPFRDDKDRDDRKSRLLMRSRLPKRTTRRMKTMFPAKTRTPTMMISEIRCSPFGVVSSELRSWQNATLISCCATFNQFTAPSRSQVSDLRGTGAKTRARPSAGRTDDAHTEGCVRTCSRPRALMTTRTWNVRSFALSRLACPA
jgi:hypothetical protein